MLVVATVVGRDSTRIAPPFPGFAWLFENVEVPIVTDPEPNEPGEANAKFTRSTPPPPEPTEPAVLRLKVVPLTVRIPVDAECCGADGVNITPPPLPA